MIERQRQLIITRDGFQCVLCGLHPPGWGTAIVDAMFADAGDNNYYFEIEKQTHPLSRLQVDHVHGRSRKGPVACEQWTQLATLCEPCHRTKSKRAKLAEIEYLHNVGQEPPEYAGLLVLSQEDWERRRKASKATRKRAYTRAKEYRAATMRKAQ
jgi:hypothetical protein